MEDQPFQLFSILPFGRNKELDLVGWGAEEYDPKARGLIDLQYDMEVSKCKNLHL